jgi:hypothetical protein
MHLPYSLIKTTRMRTILINYLEQIYARQGSAPTTIPDIFAHILNTLAVDALKLSPAQLAEIKTYLLSAPIVTLSVPYALSDAFIDRIYPLVFKQSEGLFAIELNSTISGGFILYKDGVAYNYSINYLVKNLFADASFKNKLAAYL